MSLKALCIAVLSYTSLFSASSQLSKVIQDFSSQVEKKYDLSYISSLQWGEPKVYSVSLYYASKTPQLEKDAKVFIEELTQEFLSDVNSSAALKNDLKTFPMRADQLEIEVFFRGKNGKYAAPPNIARAEMNKGLVNLYEYKNAEFKTVSRSKL